MNFKLIDPRVWLEIAFVVVLVGLGWWTYNWIYDRGADHVQVKWDAEKLDQAQQSLKITTEALATTRDIQASADKIQETKDAQIKAGNALAATIAAGLRERPARPSNDNLPGHAPAGTATTGCTGAGLYRPDAEFSLGEASTSNQLRIALKACYTQYNTVKAKLDGKSLPPG
jgi:hypothetical protein